MVQRSLGTMICSNVQDKRDWNAVMRLLGGASCDPKTPDAALAAFLTALLNAVYE